MLKIGDKLLTRTTTEIDADGSFTVKPDEEGHSWKNFYTIVN